MRESDEMHPHTYTHSLTLPLPLMLVSTYTRSVMMRNLANIIFGILTLFSVFPCQDVKMRESQHPTVSNQKYILPRTLVGVGS